MYVNDKYANKTAWFLIVIYTAIFTYLTFRKFDSFSYFDYDLAHNSQIIYNILHFKIYSSLIEMNFLGNHFHLIFYLIAPFYALWQSPKTLLFIQSLFLGLAAWPLYLLAKKELNNLYYAITFVAIYLFYPALGYVNLFEFHANIFIPFFLIFTFYFFINNRFKAFLISSLLSLSCQENISLIIFIFGFYAFLNKRSLKWMITPFILGSLWFIFTLNFIMPLLNNGNVNFFTLYSHLGNSFREIIKTIILKPVFVLKQIFTVNKGIFLLQLFVPVSFLAFFAPKILFLAMPVFLQHLLSLRLSETSIYYHYTAEIIPIVFIASIYGLKYILRKVEFIKLRYRITSLFLITITIFSNLRIGPQLYLAKYLSNFRVKAIDKEKERLLKMIPGNTSVVATFEFLPKLSLRSNLHSFHFIYSGHYTLTTKKYEIPEDLAYALIDFNDPLTFSAYYSLGNSKNMRKFLLPDDWGVVELVDNIVLFKKQYQSKIKLYEILNSKDDFGLSAIKINDKITLLKCDINKDTQLKERISFVFYWKCHEKMNEDYAIILKFLNKNKKIFYEKLIFPCYRIYPTHEWNKGDIIKDWHCIFIPEDFKDLIFNVEIILLDQRGLMIRA